MRHETEFAVRYLTEDPVPIRDIIASLQGADAAIREAGRLLPLLVDGIKVEKVDIKVREVAQESPLRELFVVALFLAFQPDLEEEVPQLIANATGMVIPDRFDTVVTVLALIVVFYGAGALKDLVFGKGADGAAKAQLDGLIKELAPEVGKSEKQIRDILENRYSERTVWKRLANTTSRFFAPSKQQNSAPMEINGRQITRDTVQDIPAEFLVDDAADENPTRYFANARIELRAEDKDHTGRGWAGVVPAISDQRLRMKLMEDVSADDLWGRDAVVGDLTVIYEKVGAEIVPKEIHLHNVKDSR
ncbi:hypothetical protein [Erythrobacter mangrovi]|uniref:Uncharacterized protein n=1 Tax=Erythrobacter mangrovi TaxID=2739433 RepID=A0A7D3XNR7_9SPHN|nr:hypothetical protein [Erythrobacter mangrovi]QKG70534.1 hypothetical protein HQR01_03665 [Erythrobacter mangrovi]